MSSAHDGQLFINGEWRRGGGTAFQSHDSADNRVVWDGRSATTSDVIDAVARARDGQSRWRHLGIDERIGFLRRFCDLVTERKEVLAETISSETGKPLWEARTEVGALVGKLEPSIHAAAARSSTLTFGQPSGAATTTFVPLGVVAVIGPFNFPMHMPNVHIMPALLAGNAVAFKPSDQAPLSAQRYVECWQAAGLPNGVMNLIQGGADVGEALVGNPDVAGVFFTGSRPVGEMLGRQLVNSGKMVALEMGGTSPLVVWDANQARNAVYVAVQSCFVTSGQRCSSARRLIVRNNDFGHAFIEMFVKTASSLRVGRYSDRPEPFMGPLVSSKAVAKVLEWQNALERAGAKVLLRARLLEDGTALISPGIIDITSLANRRHDEVLGPIVTVTMVNTESQAFAEAENTDYGLAAGIVTTDRDVFRRFASKVSAGVVSWNSPLTGNSAWAAFGGIKASGNYRPTGYLSVDYCVRAVGAAESREPTIPTTLPPGFEL